MEKVIYNEWLWAPSLELSQSLEGKMNGFKEFFTESEITGHMELSDLKSTSDTRQDLLDVREKILRASTESDDAEENKRSTYEISEEIHRLLKQTRQSMEESMIFKDLFDMLYGIGTSDMEPVEFRKKMASILGFIDATIKNFRRSFFGGYRYKQNLVGRESGLSVLN